MTNEQGVVLLIFGLLIVTVTGLIIIATGVDEILDELRKDRKKGSGE